LVTPTLKLRRQEVLRRYRDIIEDLYRSERPGRSDGEL
jgi:hypothetical protein